MREAPYPSDTRAKGWRFELDYELIEQSDTWDLAGSEARPWLLMMWLASWRPGTAMHSDLASIRRAIAGCVRAKDGRGRARNEAALLAHLLSEGASPTIAAMAARAARVVGGVIASSSKRGAA